jgi:hypothetical protein
MKNTLDVSTGKVAVLFLLIFISFELLGCTMVGKVIPMQNQILFSEKGLNQGTYNDGELTLNYNYTLDGRKMTLDGEITSVWTFDSIDVSLLFFDTSGTVLQETIVYYSGYREENPLSSTDKTFKTMLVVPRGAVGMSFSMTDFPYEGREGSEN